MLVLAFLWESGPLEFDELRERLGMSAEQFDTVIQSLVEQKLLDVSSAGISLTALGRELLSDILPSHYLSSMRAESFFGPLAGDSLDVKQSADVFVRPAWFAAIEARTLSNIIVGRRGSGKTTFLKFLALDSYDQYERVISIDVDRAYESIFRTIGNELTFWNCHQAWTSWILAEIAGRSIESHPLRYAEQSLGRLSSRALSESGKLTNLLVPDLFKDLYAERTGYTELPLKRRAACETVWSSSRRDKSTKPTLILLDSVERYGSDRQGVGVMLAGLVNACVSFSRDLDVNATVKCFVNKAMFDSIAPQLPNPAKVMDAIVYLDWTASELREVAERRVQSQLSYLWSEKSEVALEAPKARAKEAQTSVFSVVVKSTASTRLEQQDSFWRILEHSMYLPRHIVLGLNCLAKEAANARSAFPASDEVLGRAIERMSNAITKELISEYEVSWPGFAFRFQCLKDLPETFAYSDLQKTFARNGMAKKETEEFVRLLVDSSSIHYAHVRKSSDKTSRFPSAVFWGKFAEKLKLHPAIASAFGILGRRVRKPKANPRKRGAERLNDPL